MWRVIVTHTLAGLIGMSFGFAVGVWAVLPAQAEGPPKYRLNDFQRLPPIERGGWFRPEKLWTFDCIGSEKDCGVHSTPSVVRSQPIPEPGTLWLVLPGLLALLRWWR